MKEKLQKDEVGIYAEQLTVRYLKDKGYRILECNWKYSFYEIDIIALKDEVLHFVEVKALQSHGIPERSVTKKKLRDVFKAADAYLARNPPFPRIQFDVVCVTLVDIRSPEFFVIEDVYLL